MCCRDHEHRLRQDIGATLCVAAYPSEFLIADGDRRCSAPEPLSVKRLFFTELAWLPHMRGDDD